MQLEYMLVISFIGFVTAFITSVSGGGGLLAIPSLMALGIAPVNALALNRLVDVGVILGGGRNYLKTKKVDWRLVFPAIPFVMAGNFIGAKVVSQSTEGTLTWAILFALLLAMTIILYPFNKVESRSKAESTKIMVVLGFFFLLCQGLWGGAFGIAGATVGTLLYIHFFNKDFLEGRAIEIFASMPGVFVSAFVLTSASSLEWYYVLVVICASVTGSYVGSKVAIKTNGKIIRYFMIFVALLMIAKVAFDLLLGARLAD